MFTLPAMEPRERWNMLSTLAIMVVLREGEALRRA